jgi:hypothetical protein
MMRRRKKGRTKRGKLEGMHPSPSQNGKNEADVNTLLFWEGSGNPRITTYFLRLELRGAD